MQRQPIVFDHVVIGAGIVGLATAARLSRLGSTLLLERRSHPLLETSTHNSGVVHSGLYYPRDSLKTKLCIAGNKWIWSNISNSKIEARKCGKWIIAATSDETEKLHSLQKALEERGMPSRWVSETERREKEPHLRCVECLESPETGIVDVHSLANHFEREFNEQEQHQTAFLKKTEPVNFTVEQKSVIMELNDEDRSLVQSRVVVNCAGLFADHVAAKIRGLASSRQLPREMQQRLVRGSYASLSGSSSSQPLLSRLVYPCPLQNLAGLGVHSVIDMSGGSSLLFGPNVEFLPKDGQHLLLDDASRYSVPAAIDAAVEKEFLDATYTAVKRYLPSIDRAKLQPSYCGIRPKLSGEGEPFRDFWIARDEELYRQGSEAVVVHLLGIESPGLTASPAIAEFVEQLVTGGASLN